MDSLRVEGAAGTAKPVSVGQALGALLRNPRQFVVRWNGKAAVLSALFRGAMFLLASIKSHHKGLTHGVEAEALFGAVSAGIFGTLTQELRFAEPEWLAVLLLAGIFPVMFQVGDICFHAALGTQVFRAGMISSALLTAYSAAFNLYIMRRGTLLVGDEGRSFAEDLCALPRLVVLFLVSAAVSTWRLAMDIINRGALRNTIASE